MTWRVRNPSDPSEVLQPLPHQRAFGHSKAFSTFLAGGWGSGKTTGGLDFCDESMVKNPGCLGIIMQPTYPLMREFIDAHFRPAFYEQITYENKAEHLFHLTGDRRVVAMSATHPERIEMYNAAWAYLDEAGLMAHKVFHRVTARLRDKRAGCIRMGLTGTPHYGWLKDEFEGMNDSKRKIMHARTYDNPHLHPDYLENMLANCPARLRRAYIEGEFVAPGGSVYPEFDEDTHVIPWTFDPSLDTAISIDWSPRVPHVIFFQLIPEGYVVNGVPMRKLDQSHKYAAIVINDELVPDGSFQPLTTERLCGLIQERGYRLSEFVCDPAGAAAQETSGLDPIRIAKEMLGLRWVKRRDKGARLIVNGVDHVKNLLEPMDGIPRLYFSQAMVERAKSLGEQTANRGRAARAGINAIRGYSYPEDKESVSVPEKDGVTDHFNDCLRYAVVYYFPARRLMQRMDKAGMKSAA